MSEKTLVDQFVLVKMTRRNGLVTSHVLIDENPDLIESDDLILKKALCGTTFPPISTVSRDELINQNEMRSESADVQNNGGRVCGSCILHLYSEG